MILRYVPGSAGDAVSQAYISPVLPMFFDLSSDQHENYNLWTTQGMTMGWVFFPMLEIMGAYEKSVQEYPNIKPGEDFTGYKKK
jgi:arylsulfatase